MEDFVEKIKNIIAHWVALAAQWCEAAIAWAKRNASKRMEEAKRYAEEKQLSEKTRKLREDASHWGEKAQERTKETWQNIKEKSVQAEASAKKYIQEKNISEKAQRAKEKGGELMEKAKEKGLPIWKRMCELAKNGWASLLTFYEKRVKKSIPDKQLADTNQASHFLDGAPAFGSKPKEPVDDAVVDFVDEETHDNEIAEETVAETAEEQETEVEPVETVEANGDGGNHGNSGDGEAEQPKESPRPAKKRSKKKIFLVLLLGGLLGLPLLAALFCYCVDANTFGLFGASPTLDQLKNPIQMEASEIYSEDGDLMGKFFVENRSSVTYEELSPELIKTLVCTEDQRFYEHHGIDYHGMFSAAKDALRGHARGASTITQQLVKNLFKVRSDYTKGALCKVPVIKTLIIKVKECIGAVRIENHYSKEEILTMYLNTVTFGNNTYGIKSAAKTYFNTTPDKLTYDQAACIIGILKANTFYNPIKNPENNKKRRNVILHLLADNGALTSSQCDSLCATDLGLNVYKEDILSGYAHYFREAVYNELQDWCEENNVNLFHDGLKIYTTVNSRMQHYAEAAVKKQMGELQGQFNKHWGKENPWRDQKQHEIKGFIDDMLKKTAAYKGLKKKYKDDEASISQALNEPHKMRIFDYNRGITDTVMSTRDSLSHILKFLHCGFIAMDPHSGAVKAWVGDVDFHYWQYDKVTAKRQPGSTFKLFVYTEALRQGMCSCDTRVDTTVTWMTEEDGEMKPWTPQNASGVFSNEPMTLKTALARSVNSVAVQVAQEVTPEKIVETAHLMGIESPVRPIPSICLGTEDVSLVELATAYSVIADGGMLHSPILVSRIEDKNGKVIYESKVKKERVLDYETAFLVRDMLQEGLRDERGTSQGLWKYKIHGNTDFGGKTGTSANYSDAWYMNITPNLVTGAWVGGEYRSIHFRNGDLGQGSRAALPIVGSFLEKVLNDKKLASYGGRFGGPKEKIKRNYDCKEIEEELEEERNGGGESAVRGFFRRLFGRDEVVDSTGAKVSRKEQRRERREKRKERRGR